MSEQLLVQGSSHGFAYSYEKLLYYTMKEGLIMGIYKFLYYMALITTDSDMDSKVSFISEWVFSVWGDENKYYKVSKNIWTFLFDTSVGLCTNSDSTECDLLEYYWMFIMTVNIFFTFPLAHAAAVYDWYSLNKERYDTVKSW